MHDEHEHHIRLHNPFEALSKSEIGGHSNDEMEQPICVLDELRNCKWIKEEAVFDSGAVECV